jgi:hypothetical protein
MEKAPRREIKRLACLNFKQLQIGYAAAEIYLHFKLKMIKRKSSMQGNNTCDLIT